MRRFALPCLLGLAALVTPVQATSAVQAAPPGYGVVARETLGTGLEHVTMTRTGPEQAVHVARLDPDAPFALRAVPAGDNVAVSGGLERTSSICARVGCVLAVNGDFWEPKTKLPIGGLVSDGRLLRSPISARDQLVLAPDGRLHTGGLEVRGSLVSTDLRTLALDGVDVSLGRDRVVLHTRAWRNVLPADPSRLDLVVRMVRPVGVLHLQRTAIVQLVEAGWAMEATPIPRDGAVLSGKGTGAKRIGELWRRIAQKEATHDALLRLESTPQAIESIGGSPVLVSNGRFAFPDVATSFVRARHPRTLAGRTASGAALLVTVDGRQPGHGRGMSLADAAQLMLDLGAVDAINLDGGGSTTFVRRGQVVNRPSDILVRRKGAKRIVQLPGRRDEVLGHVERPVAVALAVVPRTAASNDEESRLLGGLNLPPVVNLAVPHADDPASDVAGGLPAIVAPAATTRSNWPRVATGLVALAVVLSVTVSKRPRRVRVRGVRPATTP